MTCVFYVRKPPPTGIVVMNTLPSNKTYISDRAPQYNGVKNARRLFPVGGGISPFSPLSH